MMCHLENCDGCNREAEIRIIVEGSSYCGQCRQKWLDEEEFYASGTLTGGGDAKQAPGESLSGPTAESGDAHA